MRIRGSFLFALFLAIALGAWMYTGELKLGGQSDAGKDTKPIAEREAEDKNTLFKVRYIEIDERQRSETIEIRGRTKADATLSIRSETGGILEKRHFKKGDFVKSGDLVCEIDKGVRLSRVTQAEAQLDQAKSEYESNLALQKKGFATKNRINQLKAAFDGTKAALAEAKQELKRVEVRANASGIVRDPIAEVGDVIAVGGVCITLTDNDPMLFTGQVPELKVDDIKIGMSASIKLITDKLVAGKVRYISDIADANTRTFEVEIELDKDQNVRDGMTAQARIELEGDRAFNISPSWVTLSDDGVLGVRTVSEDQMVSFTPVKIISQDSEGFWVTGLKNKSRIITLGQEYVSAGENVEAIPDTRFADENNKTSALTK